MNEIGWSRISGQPDPSAFERLIRRVNQCTLEACERILPACAGPETLFDQTEIDELELASLSGADLVSMVQPIRSILMRGGKGWRGYALALCCEAVGGDFSRFGDWLAFSEILHVGSLIVDDVEEASPVRRGDAACHMMYGVPIAINAGTLAYFVVQGIIDRSEVNSPARARLYKEYVDLLRMAHVGQALDLALGIETRTPALLLSAPSLSRLEQEVRRAHRLKSGVPFRGFARIGAILGGGAAAEIAALGRFFLRIGTMFQLLDDVLNIEGFDGNLKQSGEDIAKGKLTLPILRAIQLMSDRERADFIRDWAACENDPARVGDIAGRVRDTGALSECIDEIRAEQIASWTELNAALDNSTAKAILKMFSERMLTAFY
jgi:geranylgeranyl pyrophosphate synthase